MDENWFDGWKKKKSKTKKGHNDSSQLKDIEPSEAIDRPLLRDLKENKVFLKEVFQDCSDVVFRELRIHHQKKGLIVFVDGMIESKSINDHALEPLFQQLTQNEPITPVTLEEEDLTLSQLGLAQTYTEVLNTVLNGNAILLIDGYAEGLILKVRAGMRRAVQEPATEAAIRGPREGFTENLRTNTALVRFKIKSPKLKTIGFTIGNYTLTNVVLSYIDGLVDPRVIDEVKNRLNSVKIDGVLETGYIEELIEDEPYSPFPQLQYTERPDTVAGQLLEGKFAIFVDGTPFVMTAPITGWQMLHASEDYYERFWIANFIRWLRILFLFISLFTPALYIAVLTYHQDMLPTTLILSVAAAREAIPFPAIVEALIMEITFEALREASVRLPKTVGQSVSILGALVIGTAAVEAGIVSAPMVIIVSVTGIASFTIPRFNFAISIRLLRFPLMFLAASFGLFGIVIGTVWIAVHLCHLRSFGVPYLSGVAPYEKGEVKDIFARVPWWKMIFRPTSFSDLNRKRMNKEMKPSPEPERW